ncbi:MAG TPA: MEKHLA domain-containing protein [Cyanobacteria bacterium UBA11149]|nr:MEKHLA domain-containing protein [Cyanobacteria bacterium UBA11367]HBE59210.1 MEKHLA domain-containing protein [Cyanobacteria bacterium UBA11366]HBK63679.1 MEKHLA domain-containing protein [Cyanobacteria bacterium UBA11166]HBR72967.1 MEKHLA domain-containing protein [Cyanobacteria bacterium UBA11159]HBS69103.1 MEKHLA domain-containing protein [Cyanobacteria bacterium UBA11153]HBW90741.1 MEKHLA domain-containing protein [Cyanobacteria bacterium UBA11149]HCA97464.1 MEKHLA domain-containing p
MSGAIELPWQEERVILHSQRLLYSFKYWLGYSLLEVSGTPREIAAALFEAPFVLVSHGRESDPIFNYGNRRALELWELSWQEFTQMPSRKTAETMAQEERNRLLAETTAKGFVSNYSGVRISSTGKRFKIEDGIVWNVLNENNQQWGQAAVFFNCQFIE